MTPAQIADREAKALQKWGCSYAEYIALRCKPMRTFQAQRRGARCRGISWQLNLWQWWSIWQQSGKWSERGSGQGYVMCRKGDLGPYAVDNVFIATARENSSDRIIKKKDLPIGVTKLPAGNFQASRGINGRIIYLGVFPTSDQAYAAYLSCDGSRP